MPPILGCSMIENASCHTKPWANLVVLSAINISYLNVVGYEMLHCLFVEGDSIVLTADILPLAQIPQKMLLKGTVLT